MTRFSILDLSPITEGSDARQALLNSRDLAGHAERLGYERFWLAEHHGMPGIASAATAVAIAHVAAGTSTIRVGAGGIMLPNHAPLVIAEQFGTLAALFPGRIELGIGRAPGTDPITTQALRRTLAATSSDQFVHDVLELMAFLGDPVPGQRVHAVPGEGSHVPIWILGSSLYGAQLAAALGLPFGFASHFAPADLMPAITVYRERFEPSAALARPYVLLGFNVFAADSDEEAQLLATSAQQAFVNLRSGQPSRLPPPVRGYLEGLSPPFRRLLDGVLECTAVGTADVVRRALQAFIARTGADELMISTMMYDHAARVRSCEIAAEVRDSLAP